MNYETWLLNWSDFRAYATGGKLDDPDQPSLHKAFHGETSHYYIEAMKLDNAQML